MNFKNENEGDLFLFKLITENTCNLTKVLDCDGIIKYCTEYHEQVLGYTKDELIGNYFVNLIYKEDRETVRKVIHSVILNGKRQKCEFRMIHKNGENLWLQSVFTPINIESNKKYGVVISSVNMTEKRTIEKALNHSIEVNKYRVEFLNSISHELKTPINLILSAEQLTSLALNKVNEKVDGIKLQGYMNLIRDNSLKMVKMVNDLIDLNRINEGFLSLELFDYEVVSVLEEITQSVIPFAETRGINIVFDTNIEELYMAIDKEKIERIMLNLLSNAIKYSNKGTTVLVHLIWENGILNVKVKDEGIGMDEEKMNSLFKIQKNSSGSTLNSSGIGLSLVKSLVELQGGIIKVESEKNKGSEFVFTIPYKIVGREKRENFMELNQNVKMELSEV